MFRGKFIKLFSVAVSTIFISTSVYASTFNTGFDTFNSPLLEYISSDTGSIIDSGLISGGNISYDSILGTGSFQLDATLDNFGAVSLHDVALTTNVNGSIRMQGLIDFTGLGILNNNFIGDIIVGYDHDDSIDVTTFTYSPISFAGSSYDGLLITDGHMSGKLLDFQLTSSLLAFVDNPYPTYSPVPVPAAVWLFGSGLLGLLGLVGMARRKA